jgi:hypothetical protein
MVLKRLNKVTAPSSKQTYLIPAREALQLWTCFPVLLSTSNSVIVAKVE